MTTTKKAANVLVTPAGRVTFYTLDAPFGQKTAELDSNNKVTNGKLSIRVELDAADPATQELLAALKGNVSIKKIVKDDNSVVVQVNAGTKYKANVADADGNTIDAPSDVRINAGDTMTASLSISEYEYVFESKVSRALRLNATKIVSHDKSNRTVKAEEGSGVATFLDALNATTDKLATLKD